MDLNVAAPATDAPQAAIADDAAGRTAGPHWADDGFVASLGPASGSALPAQALPAPHWVARNEAYAAELGWLQWLGSDDALALLSGNAAPAGRVSVATAYSGHQFGVWAGQLGDGRALLLGEAQTPLGRLEVQLKGSGLTPYSRMGDGRAVLRSSIREYLCSEAMHALGIPTTRALALVGSPLPVRRETVETAAVVTRVAPSFLRFGHFEHHAHTTGDVARLRGLADLAIGRYFADEIAPGSEGRHAALLRTVALRTADLMAQWMAVGFCHGVMNTDNMSLLGLTIDYGPFGFLDAFDPDHVCNHSDEQGRYAWSRQPAVAQWNLHALAQALLPLLDDDTDAALQALAPYKPRFEQAMLAAWRAKLGLAVGRDDDAALVDDWLELMARDRVDFTIAFRRLAAFSTAVDGDRSAVRDLFVDRPAFDAWAQRYAARLASEASVDAERAERMRRTNPKYVLRNHLAQTAIESARQGEFGEVDRLLRLLQRPYDEQPENEADAGFPPDWASQLEVSCSS